MFDFVCHYRHRLVLLSFECASINHRWIHFCLQTALVTRQYQQWSCDFSNQNEMLDLTFIDIPSIDDVFFMNKLRQNVWRLLNAFVFLSFTSNSNTNFLIENKSTISSPWISINFQQNWKEIAQHLQYTSLK